MCIFLNFFERDCLFSLKYHTFKIPLNHQYLLLQRNNFINFISNEKHMSFSHTFNRSSHRRLDRVETSRRNILAFPSVDMLKTMPMRGWRYPAWERLESDKLVRPYIIICDRQVKRWQVRADILIRRSNPPHVLSITIVTSLTTPCRIAITFATTGARIPLEATWIFHRSIVPSLIKRGPDVTRDNSFAPLLQYCRGGLSINFDFHSSEYQTRGKRVDKAHDSIKRFTSLSFLDLYPAFRVVLGWTSISLCNH